MDSGLSSPNTGLVASLDLSGGMKGRERKKFEFSLGYGMSFIKMGNIGWILRWEGVGSRVSIW